MRRMPLIASMCHSRFPSTVCARAHAADRIKISAEAVKMVSLFAVTDRLFTIHKAVLPRLQSPPPPG